MVEAIEGKNIDLPIVVEPIEAKTIDLPIVVEPIEAPTISDLPICDGAHRGTNYQTRGQPGGGGGRGILNS